MVMWRKYRGGRLYTVVTDLWHMRLPDHLEHGYENRSDFFAALRELSDRWHGRVGDATASCSSGSTTRQAGAPTRRGCRCSCSVT